MEELGDQEDVNEVVDRMLDKNNKSMYIKSAGTAARLGACVSYMR